MEEVVKYKASELATYSPSDVMRQVTDIQNLMSKAMKEGEHYGTIPGCGDKPALLKPGAEKITFMFRLAPSYDIQEKELPNGHVEYRIITTLTHINTGLVVGQGVGLCSTMESKYRYRNAARKCPSCGKETIIAGKAEYGGGFLCYTKKGGCGAKFKDGDPAIVNQEVGKIENENPADHKNTVLKMGKKRSLVDATLTATAASDIFTQDVEELVENGVITPRVEPETKVQSVSLVQRDYTKEVNGVNSIPELEAYWKALTKDEQNKYKGLVKQRKEELLSQEVVETKPGKKKSTMVEAKYVEIPAVEELISGLTVTNFSIECEKIEKAIESLKLQDDKIKYIVQFKAKLAELKIDYEIKAVPF